MKNNDEAKNVLVKALAFSKTKGVPEPEEKTDKKYGFVNWGKKNDYPFYLVDMYKGSAWHQGIMKTKTYYIAGGGIETVSGQLNDFLENKFSDFKIDEVVKRLAFDYEMFDAFCVQGTWNKEGTRVVRWEHIDLDKVRVNADESLYYISENWSVKKQTYEDTGFREVLPLDEKRRVGKFLIYYKSPTKQSKNELGVYPHPNYCGGLTAINTDVLISKYHLHEIQNGFKGGTIVNLANGQPETDEEAEAIKDEIKGSSTDISDTNQLIITFSDGQENAPTVLALNGNDLADRYNMTEQSVQQNILVAHSITSPNLFGIKQDGSFNSAESQELFEVWVDTYVKARQETLEWALNLMAKLSGAQGELKLAEPNPFKSKVEPTQPVETQNNEFRSHENDLKVFLEYGKDKSAFKVVKSMSISNDFTSKDVEKFESDHYGGFFDKIGDIRSSLSDLDKNVLELLRRGEDGSTIQNATGANLTEVAKSIDKLNNLDLITDGETNALGEDVLQGQEIEADRYEVRYSYEVKPGLGAEKISTTRPFCETLIDANRMYTRMEIDTISGRIGRDAWRYRGGFYHNPKTGRTTPWCRHEWVQHLVVKN